MLKKFSVIALFTAFATAGVAEAGCLKTKIYECVLHVSDGAFQFSNDGSSYQSLDSKTFVESSFTQVGTKAKIVLACAEYFTDQWKRISYTKNKELTLETACRDYIKSSSKKLVCETGESAICDGK